MQETHCTSKPSVARFQSCPLPSLVAPDCIWQNPRKDGENFPDSLVQVAVEPAFAEAAGRVINKDVMVLNKLEGET